MDKIEVPICNSCNKPHFGRNRVEDRCICDTFGNFHYGEIEVEDINNLTTPPQDSVREMK